MKRTAPLPIVCLIFALAATASAQHGILLKMDNIFVTPDAPGHSDFVKGNSVIIAPNSDGDGGLISITKQFDKASPILARHADRKTVTGGEIGITAHGYATTTYSFRFEDAHITEVQRNDLPEFQRGLLGGDVGENIERVILECKKIKIGSEGNQPVSNVHSIFHYTSGAQRAQIAAFGIGTSGSDTRVGFLAEKTPPTGLLSGDRVSAVGLVLLGEDGPHHLLSTGKAGIEMSGTVNPAQMGILSDNDPRFGIILSPASVEFGQ